MIGVLATTIDLLACSSTMTLDGTNRSFSPAPDFAAEITEMADGLGSQSQKTSNSAGMHVVVIARPLLHHAVAPNPQSRNHNRGCYL